jgi:hypothetical protein
LNLSVFGSLLLVWFILILIGFFNFSWFGLVWFHLVQFDLVWFGSIWISYYF